VKSIRVIHGANLRLLGHREPERYGTTTLAQIDAALARRAESLGVALVTEATEHEGRIIELLHECLLGPRKADGVLLNAGAYAHTSLAIADAVRSVAPVLVVEVHLTNTAARASRPAVVGEACLARVEGFGARSYGVALEGLVAHLKG